jgi:trimeric autotransporter adhesin
LSFLRTFVGLHPPAPLDVFRCALAITCVAWCGGLQPAWAAQATATTLSLTSGGNAVSSVAGETVVTLTATVQAGGTALTLGQVNFCDGTAASCTDIHLLGTALLTNAGTAVLRFRPGPGNHSYQAVFLGTLAGAPSSSAAAGLTVGPRPPVVQTTFTVAAVTGPDATNEYALTASVGTKGTIPPSGTVSFLNTNNGNFPLGTAALKPVSGGTGFLNVPIPQPSGAGADALPLVAIGDFNGDGIPDIVSAPHGGIAISLGKGDGTFAAPLIPNVDSADGINAFGVGDFNGDGITDLLVDDEDTGTLTVLLGKGDGTFTVGQTMPFTVVSMAIADFNGDGKLDVALSGNPQTTILLGNGDGTFTAAPNPLQINSSQLVAADFNNDGKIDLATTGFSNNSINVLLGNGDGTFTAASNQPQITTDQFAAADFNDDGKIDLAALDPMGDTVTILLGNGDGTFATASTFATGSNAFSLTVGDFNSDSKPDLAVAGTATYPDHEVTIFAGNGDGTFAAGFDINDALAESLAVADFTGSGSSDLATFGSVLLGNLTISTATLDTELSPGFNIIQADYPGDAGTAPSDSTNKPSILVQQQVFSLTSKPIAVVPGASASGSFSVTSSGFTGTLNLSCSIPAPQSLTSPPACSVPSSVYLISADATVDLTYTVTTQATTPTGQYSVTITATYPLGGEPPALTSAGVSVAAQNFLLTNSGATIASPDDNGSSTITISPNGGFTGQVTMGCAVTGGPSGAIDQPTCAIPSPISVTGSAISTTLTLHTQPATTPGSYTVTVTGAAGSLNASTSFTIAVAAAPGFTLSSAAVTIASPGPNGTSTVTITPTGGFTGSVALSCAASGGPTGAADAPTCSVTAPPAITGGAAVTATLTVSTTAASAAADSTRGSAIGGSVVAIASLLWFGFPIRRRRTTTQLGLLLIATLFGAAIGCGGGNAAKPQATPANPGTTPGAYTVTVTGSSGAITATTAVTVTVN